MDECHRCCNIIFVVIIQVCSCIIALVYLCLYFINNMIMTLYNN